jgi:hypothetical protein
VAFDRPSTTGGFDPGHPLAAACKLAFSVTRAAADVRDYVGGRMGTLVAAPPLVTKPYLGQSLSFTKASAQRVTWSNKPTPSVDLTFLTICSFSAADSAPLSTTNATVTGGVAIFDNSALSTLNVVKWGQSTIDTSIPIALNVPYAIAVSCSRITSIYAAAKRLDTGLLSTFSGSDVNPPGAADGTFSAGGAAGDSSTFMSGWIAAGAIMARSNTLRSLVQWAEAPWEFWFGPQTFPGVYAAGGGGAAAGLAYVIDSDGGINSLVDGGLAR